MPQSGARFVVPGLFVLALCALTFALPRSGSQSQSFAPGGFIHIRVPVGDIHVVSTQNRQIELRYTIRPHSGWFGSEEQALDNIQLHFAVHGDDAIVDFENNNSGPNNGSIDVELDVPSTESLRIHLGVGDVRIADVAGDKDVDTGVGDIRILLNDPPNYRSVSAAVGVGDVRGGPWGEASGFIGKSLSYDGHGAYRLTAHAGVGDISFEP